MYTSLSGTRPLPYVIMEPLRFHWSGSIGDEFVNHDVIIVKDLSKSLRRNMYSSVTGTIPLHKVIKET